MADKTPDPEPTPEPSPSPDELEAKYWAKFDERLGAWFDGKMEEMRKTATSRTGGRTTIQGLLANFMFGPEKKD